MIIELLPDPYGPEIATLRTSSSSMADFKMETYSDLSTIRGASKLNDSGFDCNAFNCLLYCSNLSATSPDNIRNFDLQYEINEAQALPK